MSESEKMLRAFLQRWSARKLGLEERPSEPPAAKTEQVEPADSHAPGAPKPPVETSVRSGDSAVEPVDPARLPPIESIDASTDIRAFLAPGIPAALSRAALRRAWLSDPAIRDFVGLAENQWDFTDPDAVPGFGSLEITPEIRRLVTEVFGERSGRDADASQTMPPAQISPTTATAVDPTEPGTMASAPGSNCAPQNDCAVEPPDPLPVRPKHGGALPK